MPHCGNGLAMHHIDEPLMAMAAQDKQIEFLVARHPRNFGRHTAIAKHNAHIARKLDICALQAIRERMQVRLVIPRLGIVAIRTG